MYKLFIILIFLLINSCNYPDIDSLPDFDSLNISIQEEIDLCKISNSDKKNKENCYKEIENIISGL